MKKFILFLFLLSCAFFGSVFAAKRMALPMGRQHQTANRFQPTSFPLKNHSFAIVIVGANNGAFVAKTLSSVFSQNYESYRVIYIDDASNDGSFDVARDFLYDHQQQPQITLVHNEEPLGVLANVFRAVQTLDDEEIVVVLQGEDWLAHEWVLQRLNAYYADPDLWLTFGRYKDFPTYETGSCQQVKTASLRTAPFAAMHLNTFYAALFKQIKEADLTCGGRFLPACAEMAYMLPMLEMAEGHSHCIPEILYIRNRQAVPKESREAQVRSEKLIRGLDRYQPLTALKVGLCGE